MGNVRYRLNGAEVTREEWLANCRFAAGAVPDAPSKSGWPKTSESLAVHPKQVAAATEQARLLGVPTAFDVLGRPVLTSQRHQDALAKALGYTDRSSKVMHKAYRGGEYIP